MVVFHKLPGFLTKGDFEKFMVEVSNNDEPQSTERFTLTTVSYLNDPVTITGFIDIEAPADTPVFLPIWMAIVTSPKQPSFIITEFTPDNFPDVIPMLQDLTTTSTDISVKVVVNELIKAIALKDYFEFNGPFFELLSIVEEQR